MACISSFCPVLLLLLLLLLLTSPLPNLFPGGWTAVLMDIQSQSGSTPGAHWAAERQSDGGNGYIRRLRRGVHRR